MKSFRRQVSFAQLVGCTLGLHFEKNYQRRIRKYMRIKKRIARIILSNVRKYNTARICFKEEKLKSKQKQEENIFDQIFK